LIECFKQNKIDEYSTAKAGIVSGNDADFLKLWYEISYTRISFHENIFRTDSNVIWVPINKGGGFRKYSGNEEYVINIKNLWLEGRTGKSVRRGDPMFYFKEAVTWTMVCGTTFSFRYSVNNTFATAAPALFFENGFNTKYTLGFLNSKIALLILPGINPTMNLGSGDVSRLPLILNRLNLKIEKLVSYNIELSKMDWISRETSWEFQQNELAKQAKLKLNDSLVTYSDYWSNHFYELHNASAALPNALCFLHIL
jgi:hypothetical protein